MEFSTVAVLRLNAWGDRVMFKLQLPIGFHATLLQCTGSSLHVRISSTLNDKTTVHCTYIFRTIWYYNNRVVQLKYFAFSISIVHYILDATLGCSRAKYSIESWAHCSHECNIGFSEGNLTAAARQLRATLSPFQI